LFPKSLSPVRLNHMGDVAAKLDVVRGSRRWDGGFSSTQRQFILDQKFRKMIGAGIYIGAKYEVEQVPRNGKDGDMSGATTLT